MTRFFTILFFGASAAALVTGRMAQAQTFRNGELVWSNDTNVSLYVVLESPDVSLPRRLWNFVASITNVPPSTSATLSFPIGLTNRYPDAPWLNGDFFCLLAWTNGVPRQAIQTNWYALQMVEFSTLDGAGRVTGWYRQGHWFAVTNIQPLAFSIQPLSPMPGVTNNSPHFKVLHF